MGKVYLTSEQIDRLNAKYNEVIGTTRKYEYDVQVYFKNEHYSKFRFIGWSTPANFLDETCYIQGGFIYRIEPYGSYKYRITDNMKDVLGL